MDNFRVCPKCNGVAYRNLYFNVYVCSSCRKQISEEEFEQYLYELNQQLDYEIGMTGE
jgi:ribosomal protein L37AE/L43A